MRNPGRLIHAYSLVIEDLIDEIKTTCMSQETENGKVGAIIVLSEMRRGYLDAMESVDQEQLAEVATVTIRP